MEPTYLTRAAASARTQTTPQQGGGELSQIIASQVNHNTARQGQFRPRRVFNRAGFDQFGYNRAGYDIDGFDKDGFNSAGYDVHGLDRNGFDHEGYNIHGFDRDGFDRAGYNEYGYDRAGRHRESVWGFMESALDEETVHQEAPMGNEPTMILEDLEEEEQFASSMSFMSEAPELMSVEEMMAHFA